MMCVWQAVAVGRTVVVTVTVVVDMVVTVEMAMARAAMIVAMVAAVVMEVCMHETLLTAVHIGCHQSKILLYCVYRVEWCIKSRRVFMLSTVLHFRLYSLGF